MSLPPPDPEIELTVESESQTVRAILQIRELLVQGAFEPGERIREVPLAKRLAVSRTPLRLALDRVSHEGLLERRPKGGFVARSFTVNDILDAIDLRGVLEGTAARWAAERLPSPKDAEPLNVSITAVQELLRVAMPGVDLIRRYAEINARFHSSLLALSKSEILRQAMERVLALPFASPNAFVFAETESDELRDILLISNAQHIAIADAIIHGESARAEAVAREHSRVVRRSIVLALQERRFGQIPGASLIKFPQVS